MEILNRNARHDYFIEEELECGIVLTGTEIKSIRDGKCNIRDSYAIVKRGELFLLNMFIAPYKKEILKLHDKIRLEGYTLVPLKVYFKKNKAKVLIGVCKGKKNYDKRETLKERDIKKQLAKENKTRW